MTFLDTNTLIGYLRGTQAIVARVLATPRMEMAIPAVVAYELEYGTFSSSAGRREKVEMLFRHIPSIPFDLNAARASAEIRSKLEQRGLIIGPIDLLIAGTALSRKATLATANTKEFSRVKGLALEDWTR